MNKHSWQQISRHSYSWRCLPSQKHVKILHFAGVSYVFNLCHRQHNIYTIPPSLNILTAKYLPTHHVLNFLNHVNWLCRYTPIYLQFVIKLLRDVLIICLFINNKDNFEKFYTVREATLVSRNQALQYQSTNTASIINISGRQTYFQTNRRYYEFNSRIDPFYFRSLRCDYGR